MIPLRLKALLKKEFIQMRRDKGTLILMLILPVIQLLIFGFAINLDVKNLPTAIYDSDKTQESRALITKFQNSQYFSIKYNVDSAKDVATLIDKGEVKAAIVIPHDYARKIYRHESSEVQVVLDASDPTTASSALNAAQAIGKMLSIGIIQGRLESSGSAVSFKDEPIDIKPRPWYNPNLVTSNFMVPGLLGIILTLTMVLVTSMALVREKERGTIEQLIVTPIKTWELMLGKIVPYIFIAYIQITVAIIVGYFIFHVPITGSLLLLYALTIPFMLAALGLGMLISTIAKTQDQALLMSFGILLPTILLSGFIFPRHSMPLFFNLIGYLIPATYYLEILRGIIMKGVGISYLYQQTLLLMLYAVVVIMLGIHRFKKKLS